MKNEELVKKIFWRKIKFDSRLLLLPREDVLQEIRLAVLTAGDQDVFLVSGYNLRRLLHDYGYGCYEGGKDKYDKERIKQISLSSNEDSSNLLRVIKFLYVENNYTAEELCNFFNVELTEEVKKRLSRLFPKGSSKTNRSGKWIPFEEKIIKEIVEKGIFNIPKSTIRTWRQRGRIPEFYVR